MATRACQWSGVAKMTASMSLLWHNSRKSWKPVVSNPSFLYISVDRARCRPSTSHRAVTANWSRRPLDAW